jgi:hypothetical protein
MLVIRKEQVVVLAAARRGFFVEQCVKLLRGTWTDDHEDLDGVQLRRLVRERIARAADFGLTTERELYRFLNLSAFLGHDFEWRPENEWIVVLLRNRATPFASKLDIILARGGGR